MPKLGLGLSTGSKPTLAAGGGGGCIVTDGLVWHIDCKNESSYDPAAPTVWNSLIDSANNGTITGTVALGGGPLPDASDHMWFDGSNDYAKFPQVGNSIVQDPMTLEYWIWIDGVYPGISSDWAFTDDMNTGLSVYHHYPNITGRIYVRPRGDSGGGGLVWYSDTYFAADTWYHMVFTFTGTTVVAYYNTVIRTGSGTPTLGPTTSTNDFHMGATENLSGDFKGYIDIARVYNKVLTLEEVTENYDCEKARFGY